MPTSPRRVVIGRASDGRSAVVSDALATMSTGNDDGQAHTTIVWSTPPVPTAPSAGDDPTGTLSWDAAFPAPGETRLMVITHPPGSGTEPSPAVDVGGVHFEENGMHASASVDYVVVVAGTITLEVDDGVEVVLTQGDVLVQNGTRHGWRNRGDVDAVVAVVLIGATGANDG